MPAAGKRPGPLRAALRPVLIIVCLAAVIAAACAAFWPRACRLAYRVLAPPEGQMALRVELDIANAGALGGTVYLSALSTGASDIEVTSGGKPAAFDYENGTLSFSPAPGSSTVGYSVRLGELGKHGENGVYSGGLIAFSGEQVFILPEQLVSGTDAQISRLLSGISIDFELPGKARIIPFDRDGGGSVRLNNPKWAQIYDLSKNAYVFGDFIKYPASKYNVFYDAANAPGDAAMRRIGALFGEYARLYGESPPNLNIILLSGAGDNPDNPEGILGGAGTQTICGSFDPNSPRAWQLLSHRMGHAFFDAAVKLPNFHNEPMLWFYEGLITYYENKTMDVIGYSSRDCFSELAGRYYYMRLKDPALLSVTPMDAGKLLLSGQREFLHYTYAPLIYKRLLDLSGLSDQKAAENGGDGILRFILDNRDNADIDMRFILNGLFGSDFLELGGGLVKDCVYGGKFMPAGFADTVTDARMLAALRDYEELLWTWFATDIRDYPLDDIGAGQSAGLTEKLVSEAVRRGVSFADGDVPREVYGFSPAVYNLLMEYALRADVCGVPYGDPDLRVKLLADSANIEKWNAFIRNGFMYSEKLGANTAPAPPARR